jgi:hypothetical protein
MPLSIGEVTSDVTVDAPGALAPATERLLPEPAEAWRWQALQRRQAEDAARTAALHGDD